MTKNGFGRDDARQVFQNSAAQLLAFRREPPSLVVSESESLSAELFLEDSILLAQVLDRRLLMLVDPPSEDRDEELPWLEDLGHQAILRAVPVGA